MCAWVLINKPIWANLLQLKHRYCLLDISPLMFLVKGEEILFLVNFNVRVQYFLLWPFFKVCAPHSSQILYQWDLELIWVSCTWLKHKTFKHTDREWSSFLHQRSVLQISLVHCLAIKKKKVNPVGCCFIISEYGTGSMLPWSDLPDSF